jgi:glyoxylase-like metal-dependent hydrolase (beta-lactamase superfamily II)
LDYEDSVRFAQSIIDTFPQLQLRLPDHTFSDRVEFKGSKRTAEFVTFGGGHTESDAILYLPAERIIFTGDLLVIKNHPDLTQGDPHTWLDILAKVKALNPAHLIPGHGEIGTLDDVIMIERYIKELLQMAEQNQFEEISTLKPPAFTEGWENADAFEENMKFLLEKFRSK